MNSTQIEHNAAILGRLLIAPEFAEALLQIRFSPEDEHRMRELMEMNNREIISAEEQSQIEAYRRVGTFLAIIQAKARKVLTETQKP